MSDRLILGTAGHIDHGKTALIQALTGVDCDRLPEEKQRGITIELGFAPLDLPSGRRLGVIDVPGHERLVRTMVSGAAGIDLVLFVVAVDEGIMPQSREHLAVCELLGVERGVVALTKIDAVPTEWVELARLEVEEELAGRALAAAPIIPVSALRREGLDELRAALDGAAEATQPRTAREGPAWLAVDRSFSMRGFGTVVTGTLRGGALNVGNEVELWPDGGHDAIPSRVRGIQVHAEDVAQASPGMRCALNLANVEVADIPRGSVVAEPGRLARRPRVDVELTWLAAAPPLRSDTPLMFHLGTAERVARVSLLSSDSLAPGETGLASLRFDKPLVAPEGERFVVRGFARLERSGWTLGGGRILDAAPGRMRRRHAERLSDLRQIAAGEPGALIAARLRRARLHGVSEADLLRDIRSLEPAPGVRVGSDLWLARDSFESLMRRCVRAIERHHLEKPIDAWVGLAAIQSQLPAGVADEAVRRALQEAVHRGGLEAISHGYRRPGHRAHVADPMLAKRVMERFEAAGLAPPKAGTLADELGVTLGQLEPVIEHWVREERLVRVANGLIFERGAVESLRSRLIEFLEAHGEINPARFKELSGQTRKFSIPLLEFFDAQKLTIRRGNVRLLRR